MARARQRPVQGGALQPCPAVCVSGVGRRLGHEHAGLLGELPEAGGPPRQLGAVDPGHGRRGVLAPVGGVDCAAREHESAAHEDRVRRAPHHQDLEAGRVGTQGEDGAGRADHMSITSYPVCCERPAE